MSLRRTVKRASPAWAASCWIPLLCGVAGGPATATASESADRNWPQWRGPSGNGVVLHGDPPIEWSEETNVAWKVAIPGQGHATPVIWGQKVFVLTAVPSGAVTAATAAAQVPAGQIERPPGRGGGRGGRGFGGGERPTQPFAFTVLCLERATGKTIWEKAARREVPHQAVQPSNTYCSGSPVTDGERLYVSFGSYGLYCYDLEGDLVWEKDLGKVSVTFGEGSSPALCGDALVVVQDNNGESFVYAFDKRTGKELWKQARDEESGWTTPFVLEHGGHTQVVINGSKAVRSYDPRDGKLLWQCSGLGSNPVPMVVADERAVYAMSGHRNPAGLAIKLGRSGDLTGTDAVVWRTDRGTPYVPSPLLHEGLLYFCQRTSAVLTCLDAASGKPHYEQARLESITGMYSSPVAVRNRIYLAGQNGVTAVLAHAKEFRVLATNRLEDGFDASPAVVDRELFLRGRKHLYCLAAR